MKIALTLAVAAAVAGGLAGAVVAFALDGSSSTATAAPKAAAAPTSLVVPKVPTFAPVTRARRSLTAEQIYARDAPGVVVITDTETQAIPPTLFTPAMKQRVSALGSGFVIDNKGDIVTNAHVVEGGSSIRVGFSSGATYPAKVIGADASSDVAVVRVKAPASALHPLAFDDSARIHVGDRVYAIGNPFGLDRTMTAGIVSATGRDIESPNGLTIANAIQTDAPINHGNSGGPLLDGFGRVIGINAQIQGGTVNANVGIGFAIPSNTARVVVQQLIATGHAEHAWLGVQVETIDPSVASSVRGLPSEGATIVRVVAGSPAAKAGLKPATRKVTVDGVGVAVGGDSIVAADGARIASAQDLGSAVATHKPGDSLKLEVVRGGARRTVRVTLGNAPNGTP